MSIDPIQLTRKDVNSVEKGRQFNIFQVQLEFKGDEDSKNLSHTLKLLGAEPADAGITITRDSPGLP